MKKCLFASLFLVAAMFSQSWAEDCLAENGQPAFCRWDTGCWGINNTYPPNEGKNCTDLLASCAKDGYEYTGNVTDEGDGGICSGGTWTGKGKGNPNESGTRGYCDWGACVGPINDGYGCTEGGCFEIMNDTQAADCNNKLASKSQCPAASLPPAAGGTGGGNTGGGNTGGGNTGGGNTGGGVQPPPSPPGGGTQPIIKTLPGAFIGNALTAMQNAVNLQAAKGATLSIYDMKGNMLRSQKVEAGNHLVQLPLPRGLYVVQAASGSWKQTVKVAVK